MRAPLPATRIRAVGWGAVVVGAYLAAAALTLGSGRLPLRPFFEGTAPPQPYRWVNPPTSLKAQNTPPERGEGTAKLGAKGSQPANIATNDGQALIALTEGSVKPSSGETELKITIEPLDAATLGPPPQGLHYDGNAYRYTVTYARSGKPAEFAAKDCPVGAQPKLCPTIVMRYAFGATGLYRRDGTAWTQIQGATPAQQSLQIFGDAPGDGVFVAAGPPRPETTPPSKVGDYVAIGLGGVAVLGAIVLARSKQVRRRWRRWRKKRSRPVGRTPSGRPVAPRKRKKPSKTYGKGKRKR